MPLSPWPKLRSGGNKAADTMHPSDKTKRKPNPRLLPSTNRTMQLRFSLLSRFNTYLQFLVFPHLLSCMSPLVGKSSLFLSSFLRFLSLFPSSSCVGRCVFHFVLFDDDDDDDDNNNNNNINNNLEFVSGPSGGLYLMNHSHHHKWSKLPHSSPTSSRWVLISLAFY